ncbi:MAG: hypothetical protein AAFX06_21815 [Planctomycetota bacterium]
MSTTAIPDMLRIGFAERAPANKSDRENNVLPGYVVAELGDFGDGRGHFSEDSLKKIVELGNASERGLKSRLAHPNMSEDGVDKHLGRAKNFRLSDNNTKVRADLHFAPSALDTPVGGGKPLGIYVMDRADEDSGAISSSLVLRTNKLERGEDADGERMPPLWIPEELMATDIVGEGAAVHGDLLSLEGLDELLEGSSRKLPNRVALAASEYLNQLFPDADREVVESRFNRFRDRYLSRRFGAVEPPPKPEESGMDQETKDALAATNKSIEELGKSTDDKLSKLTELITTDREERKQELSAKDRAAEISALCEMAGADRGEASKFIADEKLSAEDVRKTLFERLAKKNSPPADDNANELGTNNDPDAKYRKDYAEQLSAMKQDGVSEAEYINWRRKKDGLAPHPSAAA